jgi:hypothetical protein
MLKIINLSSIYYILDVKMFLMLISIEFILMY